MMFMNLVWQDVSGFFCISTLRFHCACVQFRRLLICLEFDGYGTYIELRVDTPLYP